jgi:hypothetical protein
MPFYCIGDAFDKKHITLEKRNTSPEYFRRTICENFPQLSDEVGGFSLWQVRGNKTDLVPVPANIDNADALCQCEELNRSCVYVRPQVCRLLSVIFIFTQI